MIPYDAPPFHFSIPLHLLAGSLSAGSASVAGQSSTLSTGWLPEQAWQSHGSAPRQGRPRCGAMCPASPCGCRTLLSWSTQARAPASRCETVRSMGVQIAFS